MVCACNECDCVFCFVLSLFRPVEPIISLFVVGQSLTSRCEKKRGLFRSIFFVCFHVRPSVRSLFSACCVCDRKWLFFFTVFVSSKLGKEYYVREQQRMLGFLSVARGRGQYKRGWTLACCIYIQSVMVSCCPAPWVGLYATLSIHSINERCFYFILFLVLSEITSVCLSIYLSVLLSSVRLIGLVGWWTFVPLFGHYFVYFTTCFFSVVCWWKCLEEE